MTEIDKYNKLQELRQQYLKRNDPEMLTEQECQNRLLEVETVLSMARDLIPLEKMEFLDELVEVLP